MTLDPSQMIGRAVGRFTLDELIGGGSFAWVFKAHRQDDGGFVAIKILRPRYAGDQQFETRFRNEAQIASEFDHFAIVRILDVGQDGEITYFAMDYYPETLGERLERMGTLPEEQVIEIARSVAAGLQFAHDAGIIHRDIKVDNILFSGDGRAVIADFGIARAVSGYTSATGKNMTIGTPHYVSPEQAQGRALDGRSDLYALGVTLYRAITGSLPFTSTDWFELARMHVEDSPTGPREHRPDISQRLERIVLRLLAKDPADRYESADALVRELDEIRSQARLTGTFGMNIPTDLEPRHEGGLPGWLMATAAAVVVVVVAILVVLLAQR